MKNRLKSIIVDWIALIPKHSWKSILKLYSRATDNMIVFWGRRRVVDGEGQMLQYLSVCDGMPLAARSGVVTT